MFLNAGEGRVVVSCQCCTFKTPAEGTVCCSAGGGGDLMAALAMTASTLCSLPFLQDIPTGSPE